MDQRFSQLSPNVVETLLQPYIVSWASSSEGLELFDIIDRCLTMLLHEYGQH